MKPVHQQNIDDDESVIIVIRCLLCRHVSWGRRAQLAIDARDLWTRTTH